MLGTLCLVADSHYLVYVHMLLYCCACLFTALYVCVFRSLCVCVSGLLTPDEEEGLGSVRESRGFIKHPSASELAREREEEEEEEEAERDREEQIKKEQEEKEENEKERAAPRSFNLFSSLGLSLGRKREDKGESSEDSALGEDEDSQFGDEEEEGGGEGKASAVCVVM